MSLSNVEIIVGTYEEFLLGYKVEFSESATVLVQSFADHGHKASLRCVTLNESVLASGGADETVHLYNMEYRRECGMLTHHKGTVNCLEFCPDGSYLITGGDDGVLAVCKTGSWQLEKVWNSAHKGSAIVNLSIHPSGKMALTVGADATLRTWNLVKGRQAYATRLGSTKNCGGWLVTCVLWSPSGSFYAVAVGTKVDVYSVNTASIVYSITSEKKISCLCFINDETLCAGDEEGMIFVHDIKKQRLTYEVLAHKQRVKCLSTTTSHNSLVLVSASSNGHIKVWEYEAPTLHSICEANCGCRITCLTVATWGSNVKIKNEEETNMYESIYDCIDTKVDNDAGKTLNQNQREVLIVEEEDDDDTQTDCEMKNKRRRKKTKKNNNAFNVEFTSQAPQNVQGKETKKSTLLQQKFAFDAGGHNGQDSEVKVIASIKKKKLPKTMETAMTVSSLKRKGVQDAGNITQLKKDKTLIKHGFTVEAFEEKKIKLGKKRSGRVKTVSSNIM